MRKLSEQVSSVKCHHCNSSDAFVYADMFICYDCQRHHKYDSTNINTSMSGNVIKPAVNYSSILHSCQVLSSLPSSHHAVQYARSRKFPDWCFSYLYYSEALGELASAAGQRLPNGRPKLIIPFINEGKLFGFQARSLDDDTPKYITVLYNKDEEKIFGRDRTDVSEPFFALEGPIDSFFVKHSVAIAGSDILSNKYKNLATVCLDNEPRNPQIVSKMKKYLDLGFKIVIWPDSIKEKDVNDMIMSGMDPERIMADNVYSGLQGIVKLNSWKRV